MNIVVSVRLCSPKFTALRLSDDNCYKLISVNNNGIEKEYASGKYKNKITNIHLERNGSNITAYVDNIKIAEAQIGITNPKPLAIIANKFSLLTCSKFEVTGKCYRYQLFFNPFDALLGAGQKLANWELVESDLFKSDEGFIGQGDVKAKWNVICDAFEIYSPKSLEYGVMSVFVDGVFSGNVNLYSESNIPSSVVFAVNNLIQGRHSVLVKPESGKIAIDVLAVSGSTDM